MQVAPLPLSRRVHLAALASLQRGPTGTRTPNLLLAKELRYQLRHQPKVEARHDMNAAIEVGETP